MKSVTSERVSKRADRAATAKAPPSAEANGERLNGNAPSELHELLAVMQAMQTGEFSVRMAGHHTGDGENR